MAFSSRAPVEAFSEKLRQSMRASAINVWLISTRDADGTPHGLAVTSANALAMEPPSMMVAIDREASSFPVLMRTRVFCLNMIHSGQLDMLDHFCHSAKRNQRFASDEWKSGHLDLPYLETAIANLFCEVDQAHAYGTHTVLFGRILDIRTSDAIQTSDPLIWINGGPARFGRGPFSSSTGQGWD